MRRNLDKFTKNLIQKKAFKLFEKGMKGFEVAEKLKVNTALISAWRKEWAMTPMGLENTFKRPTTAVVINNISEKVIEELREDLMTIDTIKEKIPGTLNLLQSRMIALIARETDLRKLVAAFEVLAPYGLKKIDPDSDDGKSTNNFFNNVFQQHLNGQRNGQLKESPINGHQKERPTGTK